MLTHLPALVVVIPLLAAPLVALLRGSLWPWLLATLACWVAFVLSLLLLNQDLFNIVFNGAGRDGCHVQAL